MGGPSPPTPYGTPDATAKKQQQYNLSAGEGAQAGSMVGQETPYGSLSYSQTGTGPNGVPLYTSKIGLNPTLQNIVTSLMGQSNNLITGANYGGTDPATTIGGMTSGTTGDLLNKEVSYLDPYFKMQTDWMDTKLRNQGLEPGSPGYNNASQLLSKQQNNAITGFLAQAEPQAYNQAVNSYMLPLNLSKEEMGLVSPGYFNQSMINPPQLNLQPPDYTGAVNSYNTANMNAYNAQVAANGNMMSGLFGIPSSILGGWARGGGLGSLLGAAGGSEGAGAGAAALALL